MIFSPPSTSCTRQTNFNGLPPSVSIFREVGADVLLAATLNRHALIALKIALAFIGFFHRSAPSRKTFLAARMSMIATTDWQRGCRSNTFVIRCGNSFQRNSDRLIFLQNGGMALLVVNRPAPFVQSLLMTAPPRLWSCSRASRCGCVVLVCVEFIIFSVVIQGRLRGPFFILISLVSFLPIVKGHVFW